VSHLTTAPQAEGKGIARKLLSRAEEKARKQGALILQCTIRDSNKRSQELFKRAGFKNVAAFLYPQSGNIVGIWQRVLSTPN
jgi:ribosomal protein S18 acetylase RimI-like enzyme